MPEINAALTMRYLTIEQLDDELRKLRFAGYGACPAEFEVTGRHILTVIATKSIGAESASDTEEPASDTEPASKPLAANKGTK